ncbi:MAG: ATP-binding protein, partial [Anaerotruncus rubiinfantis]
TMTAFYQAEEYARLGAYLAELDHQKTELPQLYYAENFLVNAILSGRLGPAASAGIRIECETRVPENLPVADADLCMLLSNLLDNAVEACERLPAGSERFIFLSLTVKHGVLLIICRNSSPPRKTVSNSFPTSKPDTDCHGLGIPTMRRVTEKYDGALELRQLESVFTLQAALRLPPEKH